MTIVTALPHLEETILATTRYLANLEGLEDADLRAPSHLPDWTRAHVIAHVMNNADGLVRLLRWAQTGVPQYMYESREQRGIDIEERSHHRIEQLREESAAAAGRWLQAVNEIHADHLDVEVERMPGTPPIAARKIGGLRRNEVEIHHADLNVGYSPQHWPADFTAHLIHRRHRELAEAGEALVLDITDLGSTVHIGTGGPRVSGTAANLAWWLIGRGFGDELECSADELPNLGKWL
jgi:maleylpyruvate isomerase